MVYGALERGKLHGARPTLLNESEILAQAGVIRIVQFDYAIGLIASTLKGVLDAKKLLKIDWSTATSSGYHSQEIYSQYEAIAAKNQKGRVITEIGNMGEALRSAHKTYTSDFKNDYVYHAQIEPLNTVI